MAKSRSTKRKKGNGGRKLAVAGGGARAGGDELAQLQELLRASGAPDELLRVLAGSHNAEDLARMIEAELQMPPEEIFVSLLEGFTSLLERDVDPLTAELAGAEFLGLMRATAPNEDDLPEMLADLIGQAEAHGGPEALAMVRVLAATGPDEIRSPAAEAGDRLVATGLTDPPWVAGLGTPKVGRCFGYADEFGAQETIAITFSYGRKRHAFAVLIDHDLGGGVKDCFASGKPDVLRAKYRELTESNGLDFRDYEPAEAVAILDRALSRQPCPVQPDQVEDVRDQLDLLRGRVNLLRGQRGLEEARRRRA